jgi:hypothetical protein
MPCYSQLFPANLNSQIANNPCCTHPCRYCSIYFECTTTAKEMAHTGLKDIIPDSAGKVGGVLKDLLPLPGMKKR